MSEAIQPQEPELRSLPLAAIMGLQAAQQQLTQLQGALAQAQAHYDAALRSVGLEPGVQYRLEGAAPPEETHGDAR